MGPVGWARRPRVVARRLVADYPGMVEAFTRAMPYAAAGAGGPRMPCLLCAEAPATRAFLPCAHACVCDGCMATQGIGPMRADRGGDGGGEGKGGSHYLSWDTCPLCSATILAVVPCGAVRDARVRARVEDLMVSVASPAQEAAAAAGGGAAGGEGGAMGPLGPGFGGAEGPVPHRFRVLFGRAAKALEKWVEAREKGGAVGPATESDLAKAQFDGNREPWLSAAEYTWDEGLGEA